MKRYLEIEKIVYQELEKNCFGNKKRQGYRHLFGVSTLCIAYSHYMQLDDELCAIMGLLHDYSVYKNNTSFIFLNSVKKPKEFEDFIEIK